MQVKNSHEKHSSLPPSKNYEQLMLVSSYPIMQLRLLPYHTLKLIFFFFFLNTRYSIDVDFTLPRLYKILASNRAKHTSNCKFKVQFGKILIYIFWLLLEHEYTLGQGIQFLEFHVRKHNLNSINIYYLKSFILNSNFVKL